MKKTFYILLSTILLAGCNRGEGPVTAPAPEHMIALYAGVETPEGTKALINSTSDLAGDGFVVWGAWQKAAGDDSQYSGDYAFGSTTRVFGQGGTKVYYPIWDYAPYRFWTRGSYHFAAALPAKAFDAEHVKHNDNIGTAGIDGSIDQEGRLTLGQWDLKANQIDLMVAFDNVDNTDNANTGDDKVNLRFEHQLAQIRFKAHFASDNMSTVQINSITIYGNSRTATQATFSCDDKGTDTKDDDQITANWILGAKATSKSDNFAHATGSWSTTGATLLQGLFVFPEQYTFTLVVDYTESYGGASAAASQSAEVSGTWEAGKSYLYEFTLSSKNIIFSEPTVTPWVSGGAADNMEPM